jgi:hypothetical protein
MNKKITGTHLSIALIAGSVWGLGEVVLGAGLKSCAHLVSGSLMTGVALFFIAGSWAATRNILVPLLAVVVASLFKLFDAALLSLPVMSGSIGNPIFAFVLEGLAFVVLILLFRHIKWKRSSAALLGAGTALVAVALFPLVKFATGVPACVHSGSSIPLAIYFGPVAMAVSAVTVPLGLYTGRWFAGRYERLAAHVRGRLARILLSPATAAASLALILAIRTLIL